MEKYLKRLCNAILKGRFNERKYRQKSYWFGKEIQTMPLFCSYGKIGFTISIYNKDDNHWCEVVYDWDADELTISETPWKEYLNILYLEDNGITSHGDGELECYTNAGEDMIITLDEVTKEYLQNYIDSFDINENVSLWWPNGMPVNGVPFDNIKEHYEDYEAYLERLQKVCDKMPF